MITTPFLILATLSVLGLGISIAKHGEPKKPDVHSFWWSLFSSALALGLMYWHGYSLLHP